MLFSGAIGRKTSDADGPSVRSLNDGDRKFPQKVGTVEVSTSSDADSESDAGNYEGQRGIHNVFENSEIAEFWRKKYEESKYENRHLYDPKFIWSSAEERKVVRKADWRALLWAFIMFLALDIDRFNLKNAVSDDLLEDLGLDTNDYNLGNTLNLVCFLAAELPSQLISKAVGADRFLPTQVVLWSLVALCQCKMNGKGSFLATRCLLGFFEGGFLPEIITWLTYFYKHDEFTMRSAWFYVANPLTQAFSGLLAAGILNLDGTNGWSGWQYVFVIEGSFTLFLGFLSFQMPSGPANTRAWYRPNGWFTHREEKIMANRILRDDPSKGTMSNRQGISLRMFGRAIMDYEMWFIYVSRFLADILANPLGQYMPFLLKSLGFEKVTVNLLMVPYNVVSMVTMLLQCYFAKKYSQYGFAFFFSAFWLVIPIACLRWWGGFLEQAWPSYALLLVTLSFPSATAISIAWNSVNSNSVSRRTVQAAITNIASQASGIAGSNVFQKSDAPKYPTGLISIFILSIIASAFILLTRYYFAFRNNQREKVWSAMTEEQRIEYIKTTSDEGNKRLDFRFVL